MLGALTGCAVLAGYGAVLAVPRRRTALMVAGAGLMVLGLLAILSIGLPILAAGGLAAGARTVPPRATQPPA